MAISIPAQSRTLPPLDGDHRWWVLKSAARCTREVKTTSKKSFSLLIIAIVRVDSRQVTLANGESLLAQEIQKERNPNRHGFQKAPLAVGQFCKTQKSSSSAPIVDHAEYPITASYGSMGGRLHYSAPVKHDKYVDFSKAIYVLYFLNLFSVI